MKKTYGLKVIRYAPRLIDLHDYLDSFPGATLSEIFGVTELKENLLISMPNRWSKQAYVQGFHCDFF